MLLGIIGEEERGEYLIVLRVGDSIGDGKGRSARTKRDLLGKGYRFADIGALGVCDFRGVLACQVADLVIKLLEKHFFQDNFIDK